MGRLLDRTPLPILVLIGCLLGAALALLAGIAPSVLTGVLIAVAIPAIVGICAAIFVSFLLWLYWLAFEQPQRSLPGHHPILHLLLGLAYVSVAMLALDIVGILLGLLPPQSYLPSPSEVVYTWLLRGWLVPTAEVIPILVLMRLLADPWRRLRARLMRQTTLWWGNLRGTRARPLPPATPESPPR